MLEVEPTRHRGRMAVYSGRNVPEAEKFTLSLSRKPSEIQPWLLRKVKEVIRCLSFAVVVGICQSPAITEKLPSAVAYRFVAIAVISIMFIVQF